MSPTPDRIAWLTRAIADGTYAPPVDAVAESLVGWIAPPAAFEGPAAADRFKSPDGCVVGPLDPATGRGDTAADDN